MSIMDKYEVKELDDHESLALLKPFKGHKTLLKLTPGGWIYLPGYKKFADAYKQFEVNSQSSQDNNSMQFFTVYEMHLVLVQQLTSCPD